MCILKKFLIWRKLLMHDLSEQSEDFVLFETHYWGVATNYTHLSVFHFVIFRFATLKTFKNNDAVCLCFVEETKYIVTLTKFFTFRFVLVKYRKIHSTKR